MYSKPKVSFILYFGQDLAYSSYVLKYLLSKVPSGVREYLSVREVLDVVEEFKVGPLPVDRFLSHLKPLQPRYYSISSSPQIVSMAIGLFVCIYI